MVYPLFPSIRINMGKTLFKPGEDVVIPCEVTAYPPPDIDWFKITYVRGRRTQEVIDRSNIEAYQIGTFYIMI